LGEWEGEEVVTVHFSPFCAKFICHERKKGGGGGWLRWLFNLVPIAGIGQGRGFESLREKTEKGDVGEKG